MKTSDGEATDRVSEHIGGDYAVVVVGGGLAGLTMAACLGTANIKTLILDRGQAPTPWREGRALPPEEREAAFNVNDNRTTALIQSSLTLLEACGVWQDCKEASTPLKVMRIVNLPRGLMRQESVTDFRSGDVGESAFGYNVPNALLHQVLYKRLEELPSVTTCFNSNFKSIGLQPSHAAVTFSQKQQDHTKSVTAQLIIAADGANSPLRKALGIQSDGWHYPQTALTCFIKHSKSHEFVSTETHYPAGPFTLVPMHSPDGQPNRSSVVWVERRDLAEQYRKLDETAFKRKLAEKMRGRLGEFQVFGKCGAFPLSLSIAPSFTAPRSALIAEAAHKLPPIAAQGLNLSLRDIAVLAEKIIETCAQGRDPGGDDLLQSYNEERRFDILTRAAAADCFGRFASNNSLLLHAIREAGLGVLRSVAPLRKGLMRVGMKPLIKTPAYMRDTPIPVVGPEKSGEASDGSSPREPK